MTTKKNLVNLMLMSIVTVATTISFTACSDTFESDQFANDGSQENVTRGELLDPIALIYTDFISSSDVQIMTADTTKISISKALADKMGITSFVDHPMGIQLKYWKFDIAEWKTSFNMVPEQKLWSYEYPQDMDSKKDDPVTKVLDEATKAIQEAQL